MRATLRRSVGCRLPLVLGCLILAAAAPLARAQEIYAYTEAGQLLRLDAKSPTNATAVGPLYGPLSASPNQRLIDYRPATGELYLFEAAPGTDVDALYTIDRATAQATRAATLSSAVGSSAYTADFDPVSDRLRVVASDHAFFVDPGTGQVAPSIALRFAPSDARFGNTLVPRSLAYSDSVPNPDAAAAYLIEARGGSLLVETPTLGDFAGVGPTGGVTAFDIYSDGTADTGYAVVQNRFLFRIDLATGNAVSLGSIGAGHTVLDIAVIPAPGAAALLPAAAIPALRRRR